MGGGDPDPVTVRQYTTEIRRVYRFSHAGGDFRARPRVPGSVKQRLKFLRRDAAGRFSRRVMVQRTRAREGRWRFHRRIDRITPYGAWSIPEYIVACESHGNWDAYNPSGAAGVYQIMPEWGRPWPVDSAADMAEHHRLAAMIYRGGAGAGNWVCA